LNKINESNEDNGYWELVLLVLGFGAMATILGLVYITRKKY